MGIFTHILSILLSAWITYKLPSFIRIADFQVGQIIIDGVWTSKMLTAIVNFLWIEILLKSLGALFARSFRDMRYVKKTDIQYGDHPQKQKVYYSSPKKGYLKNPYTR